MSVLDLTCQIIRTNLQLEATVALAADTPLMGSFPEFNSQTIVGIITSIEDETGCEIDDEEISAELFETVGTLAAYIESKLL